MSAPSVDPRPGAFGKLPLAADFVAVNAGGPGVRGFTEWLQEGVGLGHARLAGAWDGTFPRMPAWRFVLGMGAGGAALAGALVPGCDRSGRRFPFTLFAGVPAGEAGATGAQLLRLLPFLEHAEAEAARLVQLGETAGPSPMRPVAEAVEGLAAPLAAVAAAAPGLAAALAAAPLSVFSALDPAGAGHLLARVGGNLLEVAARSGADRAPAYALRAPLPARGAAAAAAVAFWLELVRQAFGKEGSPRAIFWSAADAAGRARLDLYFRPPGTTAFLHLVDPAFASDALYPLDEADPAHPGQATRDWTATIVDLAARDASLEDALGRWAPRR